jgi:hypothetical protein
MMRLLRQSSLPILIALALFVIGGGNSRSAELKNPRTNQHKYKTAPEHETVENKEIQILSSVLQDTKAALNELTRSIEQQTAADEKQANAYKETYCSPAVVI